MLTHFQNRADAGRFLAAQLNEYRGRPAVVVLGLPRGGVPVAYEVARELGVPLDVFVVRKLGVPGHEELAMGAIASGGITVLNRDVITELGIPDELIRQVIERESRELSRREALYRGDRPSPRIQGRTVILVDDGLATGSTMRAAAAAVAAQGPEKVIVAVPVAASQTCDELAREVDSVVCPLTPDPFYAVGLWYQDFSPTTDQEVRLLLAWAYTENETAATSTPGEAGGETH
jgi:predicted phosphoribosyltransferase